MSERLPRLTEAELSEDQLKVYRGITGGPRTAEKQLFALKDAKGALNGPFGVMLHAPALGMPLQELGAAIRYRTRMSDRSREIAILKVARATASAFEWYAHERVARAAGLSELEVGALSDGTFTSNDSTEQAISTITDDLLSEEHFDDTVFSRAASELDSEELIEVTVLVGYYRTLAQMMRVFGISAPTVD